MNEERKISMAVIRRMPRYYRYVSELLEEGIMRISSGALAAKMGLTASQVRQDFNCFGGFGQQGYGYNVETLCHAIGEILKIHNHHKAIIIGVGNLGHALITNFGFEKSGFTLCAAFDTNEKLVGTNVSGVEILSTNLLAEYIAENKPDIAILTLPKNFAREAADYLCSLGIRGIWNFTGEDLHLEGIEIPIENVHFSESLMTLSYRI